MIAAGLEARGNDVSGGFLRFDRPELAGSLLVIRAVPPALRERRRLGRNSPLGYLYEHVPGSEPTSDIALVAGHYDEAKLVWSFSGEVTGIIGLTEPMSADLHTTDP